MKNPMYLKALGILLLAAPISAKAAVLTTGYVKGSGSLLLASNGGMGATTFIDLSQTGGSDDATNAAPSATGAVWSVSGSGFWTTGSTVNFTGLALPLFSNSTSTVSNNTSSGTFTFSIYSAGSNNDWEGGNNLATSGDSLIGTATATYTGGATGNYYVNFDSPIVWTSADSSLVVVRAASTGAIRLKLGLADAPRESFNTGAATGAGSFSLAGTVVPEPSAGLLGALGALFLLRRRR